MVQIIVKMTIIPRHAAEVIRAFRSLRQSMQCVEGLISSHLFLDAEAPDSICYVEEWKSTQDLAKDIVAAHFTRMFGLMEKSEQVPVLCVNSVSSTRGIEYLSSLLRPRRLHSGSEGNQEAST